MTVDPKALRQARRNFGLTREQAAEAVGVDAKTLAAWEQGEKTPRGRHLVWLAGLYGRHISTTGRTGAPCLKLRLIV